MSIRTWMDARVAKAQAEHEAARDRERERKLRTCICGHKRWEHRGWDGLHPPACLVAICPCGEFTEAKAQPTAPAAPKAPERGAYPICNVESAVGHHCQRASGHQGEHWDRHGNWWTTWDEIAAERRREPNREAGGDET